MQQALSLLLVFIFIGVSQSAGIGGGPIINAFLMLTYESQISISLTYIFLMGGCLPSIWKNANKINKSTGVSFVNYDLAMVSLPMVNSGSLIGSVFKNYLSEFAVSVLSVVVFATLIKSIWQNIRKQKKKVQVTQKITLNNNAGQSGKSLQNISISQKSSEIKQDQENEAVALNQHKIITLNKIANIQRSKHIRLVALLSLHFLFTLAVYLLKGSYSLPSFVGIDPCGVFGLALILLHFFVSLSLSLFVIRSVGKQKTVSQNEDKIIYPNTVLLDVKNLSKFITAGFLAGVAGATLAMGGGPILIPLWLSANIDKDVAASSTAYLILSSGLSSFTIALLAGAYQQITVLKLIAYFMMAVASSAVLKEIINRLAKKYGIGSMVLYLLLLVVVLTLIVMAPMQLLKMSHNYEQFMQFGQLC